MKESVENSIPLPQISHSVASMLVEYLYTDRIDDFPRDQSDLAHLLAAADQFQFPRLKYCAPLLNDAHWTLSLTIPSPPLHSSREMCGRILAQALDTDNAFSIYNLALAHGPDELLLVSLSFVLHHWQAIVKLDPSAVKDINEELRDKLKLLGYTI